MTDRSFRLNKPRGWLIFCLVLLYCCFGADTLVAARRKEPRFSQIGSSSPKSNQALTEEFFFYIKNFKMDHQGEVQILNIKISMLYVAGIRDSAYPDFRLIAHDVETYLSKYPNKTDYWEVLNKNVTGLILTNYPAVSRVVSEIEVSASSLDPYVRASKVTRLRRRK